MPFPTDSPLLSSFDPAIHLHSELPEPASDTFDATELEALNLQAQEIIAAKTQEGTVIQHRRWKISDVFQSEQDRQIDSPLNKHSATVYPSSPPTMPYLRSSPIAYPASSSPAVDAPKKRKRSGDEGQRSPLQEVNYNSRNIGAFTENDSDSDDAIDFRNLAKRRVFQKPKSLDTGSEEQIVNGRGYMENHSQESISATSVCEQHDGNTLPLPGRTASTPRIPLAIKSSSGRSFYISEKRPVPTISYEQLIASRSKPITGRAQKSYYGLNIHQLMDDAAQEVVQHDLRRQKSIAPTVHPSTKTHEIHAAGKRGRTLMWTEKYRARKFTDLVGDERTHRSVLRWLKGWDSIVFPGSTRSTHRSKGFIGGQTEEHTHRKILLLTGPPGLGKTTLAHVCAKQAGYEVQEINASDERSRDVVRGRIRDMVGTENVRSMDTNAGESSARKAGRPVCVVVDEVDGVVSGNSGGGGEGGFIKALIDLMMLDQRNSRTAGAPNDANTTSKKRKGDKFRMMRPLILICNDVYHPSLRLLRQNSIVEVIHMRKPALNVVAIRMQSIFEREGIPCDGDGVRRLCEATWGVSNHKEGHAGSGTVEGDIRSIIVVAEWVAGKLRACHDASMRLTRRWFEENVLTDLAHGGGAARSLGRGGTKEVVDRVFIEGAGFPKTQLPVDTKTVTKGSAPIGVAEAQKRRAFERLREMVDTSGDVDRIVTDIFSTYPTHPYQDDTFLSKPNACHEWLHFHDSLSSQLFGSQEWELAPYLSQSTLAFHHLFAASATRHHLYSSGKDKNGRKQPYADNAANEDDKPTQIPFTGPTASFQVSEATKANAASICSLQSSLSLHLARMYRSTDDVATELLPYVLRILSPDVKPVIVNTGSKATAGGSGPTSTASVRKASEKELVAGAVEAMLATGVRFERARVELESVGRPGQGSGGWVFRMEPPVDALATFETRDGRDRSGEGVRYAVRQVLDAEYRREVKKRENEARGRRGGVDIGVAADGEAEKEATAVQPAARAKAAKKDFFGRVIAAVADANAPGVVADSQGGDGKGGRIWCSFHEGLNKAVRKPITLDELLRGL